MALTQGSMDQLIALVQPLVSENGGGVVTDDTPLLSTGLIDSFAVAELAERLSTSFGVRLSVEDLGMDNADTPRQLLALVSSAA